ncbi:MAG: ABC transporter permease [Spirochaetia bacterium]|uniref:ABC transporter permease n=1 Tax=Treponema sp. TaxID=166 RepID=UPI00298EB3AF|nr:ABC transporter permease [Treponema sp.]MCI7398730.1 ABC transporter permease [Spirochaetia bacterium]MCI7577901.1 ABC transporter permease [Spirochaetia bacterium]
MKNPALALYNRVFKKVPSTENARHAKRGWKKRAVPFSFSNTVLVVSLLFLFLPLFVIVVFSFNSAKDTTWTGFSFVWYEKLVFSSKPLWQALLNSLVVAITSGIVATILGTLASIGVSWYKFLGKSYIQTVSFLPMVLPEVIMGISLLIFFSGIKMSLGLFTIFIAHTTFCLPFVYLMVSARVDEFDYSIIEASHDLGANEMQTLWKVVIPAIMPGIISGFMMSVTMSLEDYVITALVSGPGSSTLPLYVYSMIRFGVSPVINALSFVLILIITVVAVVLKNRLKSFAAAH